MADPVAGVPDRGGDPAVVAIVALNQTVCTGTLVAPDLLLTARHCVSAVAEARCPSGDSAPPTDLPPTELRVLVGDDLATAVEQATGRALYVPESDSICGADVALVALDRPIADARPVVVRTTGAARGERVRTVGFFGADVPVGNAAKVVRDHVPVLDSTASELKVAESPTIRGGGGPALDETTGEILGVVSRAADGDGDVYTRTDAFLPLVNRALAQAAAVTSSGRKARKGPADMGANCTQGADCAAGVCVSDGAKQYCSRSCATQDRCPSRFRCERCAGATDASGSDWACAQD